MAIIRSVPQGSEKLPPLIILSTFFKKSVVPIGIEILLPLILITFLSFIFDEGKRFASVSPHPFWLVILPIVVHYGTQRGLICAVFCSFFLLVSNIPPQQINQNLYDYYFQVMHNPIMWFGAAVVLGELRVRHLQENKDLKKKTVEAEQTKVVLEKAFHNLKKIKEALEVRIAAEFRTPSTPLRAVRRMIETSPDKVIDNFIKSLQELINPDQFSIFVMEGDRLNLLYNHNWPDTAPYHTSYGRNSQIFQGVVEHKRDICIIDTIGEKILVDQGVYAIPLIDPKNQEVFAMVKFEKLSFRELNLSTIEAIRELCKCACQAYVLSLEVLKSEMNTSTSFAI